MYLLCNRKFCFSVEFASYVFTKHQSKIAFTWHLDVHFNFISNNILSFYIVLCILAELRLPKRASRPPWVRKFGKPSIPENLVMT